MLMLSGDAIGLLTVESESDTETTIADLIIFYPGLLAALVC